MVRIKLVIPKLRVMMLSLLWFVGIFVASIIIHELLGHALTSFLLGVRVTKIGFNLPRGIYVEHEPTIPLYNSIISYSGGLSAAAILLISLVLLRKRFRSEMGLAFLIGILLHSVNAFYEGTYPDFYVNYIIYGPGQSMIASLCAFSALVLWCIKIERRQDKSNPTI